MKIFLKFYHGKSKWLRGCHHLLRSFFFHHMYILCGQSSDGHKQIFWIVGAFAQRRDAVRRKELAIEWNDDNLAHLLTCGEDGVCLPLGLVNPYDPNMEVLYKGVQYFIEKTEFYDEHES